MLRGAQFERGKGPLKKASRTLRAYVVLTGASIAAVALALSGASCGEGNPAQLTNEDAGGPTMVVPSGCAAPNTGCACNQEGVTIPCGKVLQKQGNYSFCSNGNRTCSNGSWGACLGDTLVTSSLPSAGLGVHIESLGVQQEAGVVCTDPNQPFVIPDQSGGFDAGTGFAQAPDGGGLSLLVTMGGGIGCAMNPFVTPSPQSIVVTSISPTLTTIPASLPFTATCGPGGVMLSPSWTLSNYDFGTITTSMSGVGTFTVYSPVATTETVTATSGMNTGSGAAKVTVNVNEVANGVPLTVPAQFTASVTADVKLTPLYPYNNTVFPLGLAAPTVQWDNKATAASYVKVSLRYPRAPAVPLFNWSIVLNGEPDGAVITKPYTHMPAYTIPQYAWSGFDRSATGSQAEIAIQRMTGGILGVGGVVHTEQTIPLNFASAPLNGTVYYTQYLRNVGNPGNYTISNTCPVGNGTHVNGTGSQVYAANMSSAAAPVDPFGGNAGCPVCHSLSGNGKTFISVDLGIDDQYGGGHPVHVGVDTIGAGGVFTQIADAPDWATSTISTTPDWTSRGFSYNAITYDGHYNLQASEFWGNTQDVPSGAPTTTQNNALSGASAAWKMYDLTTITGGPVSPEPTQVTPTGLGSTAMMTPSFSPDSTKLVYVNGDSGPGGATGWKKGLSTLSFNEGTKTFSNPTLIRNNWNGGAGTGNPMKWPFFEYDSRSLLFVETDPQEYCINGNGSNGIHDENDSTSVGCYASSYGNMSPTTRSYWKGDILSMDTATPLSAAVALANLNNGPSGRVDSGAAYDKDKAYQPTALSFASGGYRWVIFTSQRAYGNQVNPYDYVNTKATTPSCAVGQLWVAALDDVTSAATDRSHPAFWLPNQLYAPLGGDHYVNERGYLVPSACAPNGAGATSVCSNNSDCCNSNCRIDLPASSPPTRHCQAASGTCAQPGNSCNVSADCCNGANCINGSCSAAPTYPPQTFTRLYTASCPMGQHAIWHLFEWHAGVPGNATIAFSVQTSLDSDAGAFVPAMPIAIATATNANQNPPPMAVDVSSDVDTVLRGQNLASGPSLLVTMAFNPTTPGNLATPVLYDWSMTFDCASSE